MERARVVIYLPPDHPLAKKTASERNKIAKEMLKFAMEYKDQIEQIQQNTEKIINMLQNGGAFVPADHLLQAKKCRMLTWI